MSNPQEFLTKIPELPLVQKTMEVCGQGLDYLINDRIIGGLGRCMDTFTSELRNMEKAPLVNVGGNSLGGDMGNGPSISPSNTPSLQAKGESPKIEKSVMPEKVISQAQSIGSSSGMKFEHVAEANLCSFASPSTPACGVNMGMGRGGMSI